MAAPKFNNIKNYLESFGKKVVRDSKKILKKEKGNTALGESIRAKVVATAKGFDTQFFMDDYGTYLDEGVSGTEKSQSFTDSKGVTRKSSYKYTNKQPPPDILSKWIKKKGIKGRDKKSGRFITTLSLAFIIGRKIKRDGIKSISFFQKPLGVEYKKLQNQILKVLKLDIETYITTYTK